MSGRSFPTRVKQRPDREAGNSTSESDGTAPQLVSANRNGEADEETAGHRIITAAKTRMPSKGRAYAISGTRHTMSANAPQALAIAMPVPMVMLRSKTS